MDPLPGYMGQFSPTMKMDYLFYWLLFSMPVRFVLYGMHVYLQNVVALLHLTRDALWLLIELLVLILRFIRHLRRWIGWVPLMTRLLHLLYHELTVMGFMLKMIAVALRVLAKVLHRISRLVRFCANGPTWLMMFRVHFL